MQKVAGQNRYGTLLGDLKRRRTPAHGLSERNMIFHAIQQCTQSLKNLEACFAKAEDSAAKRKFDVGVLMESRLAPDMKPFTYQIQSACDYIKGAAGWLSGQRPPVHEDTEKTIDELRQRIRKTVTFVESIDATQYVDGAKQMIELSWAPGRQIAGTDYLLEITIPNVYFHLSMAYAILRHNGVDLGKMDFLGQLHLVDKR